MSALKVNSRRWKKDFFKVLFFALVVHLQLLFLQTGSGVALSFSGVLWVNQLYIRRGKRTGRSNCASCDCFVVY